MGIYTGAYVIFKTHQAYFTGNANKMLCLIKNVSYNFSGNLFQQKKSYGFVYFYKKWLFPNYSNHSSVK